MLPLPVDLACPAPAPDSPVQVEVVHAGYVHDDWSRVLDDGTKGPVALPLLIGVIDHPDGRVLVDTGLGATTREGSYPGFPISALGELEVLPGATVAERFGPTPGLVLLTHLHYDHVGGLLDLDPSTEVWTWEEEWRTYGVGALGFSKRRFAEAVTWRVRSQAPGEVSQVLGRTAVDVKGDGTIWYLSTPGHTPGSASVLVRSADRTWLFIGDTAWVNRHLEDARRPALVHALLDARKQDYRRSLAWARAVAALDCEDLVIVPGHEPSFASASTAGDRAP